LSVERILGLHLDAGHLHFLEEGRAVRLYRGGKVGKRHAFADVIDGLTRPARLENIQRTERQFVVGRERHHVIEATGGAVDRHADHVGWRRVVGNEPSRRVTGVAQRSAVHRCQIDEDQKVPTRRRWPTPRGAHDDGTGRCGLRQISGRGLRRPGIDRVGGRYRPRRAGDLEQEVFWAKPGNELPGFIGDRHLDADHVDRRIELQRRLRCLLRARGVCDRYECSADQHQEREAAAIERSQRAR